MSFIDNESSARSSAVIVKKNRIIVFIIITRNLSSCYYNLVLVKNIHKIGKIKRSYVKAEKIDNIINKEIKMWKTNKQTTFVPPALSLFSGFPTK